MTTEQSTSITHVCPKCSEEKLFTAEFFPIVTKRGKKSLAKYICKSCLNNHTRDKTRERARARLATKQGRLRHLQIKSEYVARAKEMNLSAWQEKRREESKKRAEREGKEYIPKEIRKEIYEINNYDKLRLRKSRIMLRNFLAESSDEEMACWYVALGKPWLNQRLTNAEKYKVKYKLNKEFSINERMRRSLNKSSTMDGVAELIRYGLKNNSSSSIVEERLGYTITELREHLGRQFTKGMTWDKFMKGEIHIDHIVPKKAFNLSDPEEWRSCWSLPNLRPLWAKDNIAKSARITHLL